MNSVLILGANSDIAGAVAREFAQKGYSLILAGRSLEKLEKQKQDIAIKYNTLVEASFFDARDKKYHSNYLQTLNHIPDITVCSFGYLGDQEEAQHNWSEAEAIIDTNYCGAVSILSHISNHYVAQRKGVIVGIGSVAGDRGRQSNYVYGSAKAGFSAFLSGLRSRLYKSGCHVLEVKPGFVDTKMTEGLNLPGPLTANTEQVASKIFKAVQKKANTVYVLGIWRFIMFIIKVIPEFIFKRLKL